MTGHRSLRAFYALAAIALAIVLATVPGDSRVAAQDGEVLEPEALAQIAALSNEKAARTPAERKLDSQVLYASKMARGEAIAAGIQTLEVELPDVNQQGAVLDVSVDVSQPVLDRFAALGAEILEVSEEYNHVRVRIDLSQVEALAAIPQVSFIQPKQEAITSRVDAPASARVDLLSSIQRALQGGGDAITNVGSVDSEGDVTHGAAAARTAFGIDGTGVRIGVLSDGVGGLALSQASGDLGPVTVLPGQAGSGAEGTAMLEIIHDLAPGAELYFATAFSSIGSFADNIRALRDAGCEIIVDDVGYFVETPFQDGQTTPSSTNGGIVIQAVKDVVADGALYFSSAANSGNLNDGFSGTWEGDFVDGGDATGPLAGFGRVHDFGGQPYDVLTQTVGNPITLHWSDPLGDSANDYDIYRLNSTGTTMLNASTSPQDGAQDPYEIIVNGGNAGDRIVIVKWLGADRFLHLATNRNRLSIATAGETHGHAATTALNSFGVAATPADEPFTGGQPPGPYPGLFSASNVVETFSSDGPRRIFFQGNGAAITPGDFSSTGGQVLQKPDLTAADGVSVTGNGGFPTTFYGTSAAAPHAAAIAALVVDGFPTYTPSQVRIALLASAIDIEAAGIDRDSGHGIIMAEGALNATVPPSISSQPMSQTIDSGGTATLSVSASGTPPLTYQWHRGTSGNTTTPIAGATASNLTTPPLTATTSYWVRVSNAAGAANSATATITVTPPPPPPPVEPPTVFVADEPGLVDPVAGLWFLPATSAQVAPFFFGNPGDVPFIGDWDCDGIDTPGLFRLSDAFAYLRNTNSQGIADIRFFFGNPSDIPLAGDFDGDGCDSLSLYRPSEQRFYIINELGANEGGLGPAEFSFLFGDPGDKPFVGDFDGDGIDEVGLHRESTGFVYYRNTLTTGVADNEFFFGDPGDRFVAGDWGLVDGIDTPGLFRPGNTTFYFRHSNTQGVADSSLIFGQPSWLPVSGAFGLD